MTDQASTPDDRVPAPLRVGIGGSSGLIGTALRSALEAAGHEPVPLVRGEPQSGEIGWDVDRQQIDLTALASLDAVVNLAGAGIQAHRWTDEYRRTILESRTHTTGLLAHAFADLGDDAPRVLVNASAIGFYGDRGDEVLTEQAPAGDGFLPDVCQAWEQATEPARDVARVAMIRTGIVLTPDGGALAKMLPLFKFALGGRFGDGRQWMSWISIDDEVGAIIHALTSDVDGPVNLTAPEPVTNRTFTDELGSALGRPTLIPVPKFGPRLLLGHDLADSLLFDSARVVPHVLDESGYTFRHRTLSDALADLLR